MNRQFSQRGFALTLTLLLMALIAIVVVAYLSSTRSERSISSTYANRSRAKMAGDSGLAAAIHLLKDNTRFGNYITAMPPPSPSPAPHYTEIYRPADPGSTVHAVQSNEYLRLNNAAGEILASRALPAPTASPLPQVDPRPTPEALPAPLANGSAFALSSPSPIPSASNSYDFNQIVRQGQSNDTRLVDPDTRPAWGQWVNLRNTRGEAVGRYAYFIEDESMKLNVNATGNNLALPSPTASPNLRVNDLSAIPAATPSSQIQEIDPTSILLAANRRTANTSLIGLGNSGERLPTKSTIGLLGNWGTSEGYAHLLTTVSKDDNTTARGWQRLDLNALVISAADNAAKAAIAKRLADWIRDAWTGPTSLGSLQYHQLFNDERLRLQIAANIVDYIDQDDIPTDIGDFTPGPGYADPVPVLGIEKIPYLVAVEVIYEASNSTCPNPPAVGTYTVALRFKLQFRFINLFDTPLDPAASIGKIEVKGVPVVTKNGPLTPSFDYEADTFTINLSDLRPVNGSGNCGTTGVCVVPAGTDGTSDSGAKTVQSDWLRTSTATFSVTTSDQNPKFQAGKLVVKVLGRNGERVDDTSIVWNSYSTGYMGPNSTKDFLTDANPSTGPLKIALIGLVAGPSYETGDPRFRGRLLNDRWRVTGRTDASLPLGTNRVDQYIDKAEVNSRSYGFDWNDESGNRPLAYIRNAPMLNIGELGQIAATEYPWRTLYLQHPERPANTSQSGPNVDIPLRRSQSLDYILADLFRAGGTVTRSGAININTQQQFFQSGATTTGTYPLQALFLGLPVGATLLTQAAPAAAPSPADRLSTGVNLLVSSTTVAQSSGTGTTPQDYRVASVSNKRISLPSESATPDLSPARPFFMMSEVAATLSRLISASEASDTGASTSRSKVVYSILRTNPQSTATSQNYRRDFHVEQAFREISNSITTRGNVFRVLAVGQAITDINKDGNVTADEVRAEYLSETLIAREAIFAPEGSNADALKTANSAFKLLASRTITE